MSKATLGCCPLCLSSETDMYWQDKSREYHCCFRCEVVFVPHQFHLDPEAEKAQYDLHQNDVQDPAYRQFLSRIANPMFERLQPGAQGLDFGCGSGPALATMFEEQGHTMSLYDIYYQPAKDVLQEQYDFVTATEVIEHFRKPAKEFARLFSLLKGGGYLGLMSKMLADIQSPERFMQWHYKNDPTHIIFYSETSWQWLAKQYQCKFEQVAEDAVIFRRKN